MTTQRILFISIGVLVTLVFLYMVYKIFAWRDSYFAITDKQMILFAGSVIPRVASVPISKVTSWHLRDSFAGNLFGYTSLVFKLGDDDRVVRTIGHIRFSAVPRVKEALSATPREAADAEAFGKWTVGGPRRRVRLVIAVLLICLLVALAVAAATVPRIRAQLSNETEIIALIPILIVVITPKN